MSVQVKWGRVVTVCDTCGNFAEVRRRDVDRCHCAAVISQKIDCVTAESTAANSDRALGVAETHSTAVEAIPSTVPTRESKREFLARMGARGVAVSQYERVKWSRAETRVRA